VLKHCVLVLGRAALDNISFLTEHVELDAGHTKFNAATLNQLLTAHPEYLSALVTAGSAALAAYADFLEDCSQQAAAFTQADRDLASQSDLASAGSRAQEA
jgi:hypothetical protein